MRKQLDRYHVKNQDHATIAPGANLAGAVAVGRRTWIGLSATIIEKRTVGDGALVGAAALVTHDVPARAKVIGSPARVVAENIDEY